MDDGVSEDTGVLDTEGQEEREADLDVGTEVTPSNIEELQERKFDKDSLYHSNMMHNCLAKVYEADKCDTDSDDKVDNRNPTVFPKPFNVLEDYKSMLQYIKPNETVTQALRRLGGSEETSGAERWTNIQKGVNLTDDEKNEKLQFSKLSELVNNIRIETGNVGIYEQTYADICKKVEYRNAVRMHNLYPSSEEYYDF